VFYSLAKLSELFRVLLILVLIDFSSRPVRENFKIRDLQSKSLFIVLGVYEN